MQSVLIIAPHAPYHDRMRGPGAGLGKDPREELGCPLHWTAELPNSVGDVKQVISKTRVAGELLFYLAISRDSFGNLSPASRHCQWYCGVFRLRITKTEDSSYVD